MTDRKREREKRDRAREREREKEGKRCAQHKQMFAQRSNKTRVQYSRSFSRGTTTSQAMQALEGPHFFIPWVTSDPGRRVRNA